VWPGFRPSPHGKPPIVFAVGFEVPLEETLSTGPFSEMSNDAPQAPSEDMSDVRIKAGLRPAPGPYGVDIDHMWCVCSIRDEKGP
jgi:hypothetical protein